MKSRSLRVRLLVGGTAAIFTALAISWFAMTLLFERHLERRVVEELRRDALQLIADLTLDAAGLPMIGTPPTDSRFIDPAGGLYWQLSTSGGVLKSRSLQGEQLPHAPEATGGEWSRRVADGPFNQRLLLIERLIRVSSKNPPVLVQLGHDEAAIADAADEFGRELALWLLLLWIVLALAGWIQVQLGLQPLEQVRAELERLRTNPAVRLSEQHPSEIAPLTAAINALADARENDLATARRRAADLAHALKTPLAALAAQSRRAREAGANEAADGLDRAIAAASATVEAELARARAATIRSSATRADATALPIIDRIISVVERTDFGATRLFEVDVPTKLKIPLETADAAELLGALIENAARYARRRVHIAGAVTRSETRLTVDDDGPGVPESLIATALSRGGRLDEAGQGHGLGLSIARELAEAAGGTLNIDTSEYGGLRVTLTWQRVG